MNTLPGTRFVMTVGDGPDGRYISFAPMSNLPPTGSFENRIPQPLPECPIPDAQETNKGKHILQVQQNITCRLESLKQLLCQLQHDMTEYCPDAAAQIRTTLLYKDKILDSVTSQWLYDTRRLISAAGQEEKKPPLQNALGETIPPNVLCQSMIRRACTYPSCSCPRA